MNNLEVLTKARERVDNGWVRGMRRDYMGGYCALGAIDAVVARGTREHERASIALWKKLPLRWRLPILLLGPLVVASIPLYNDMPWRKQRDILRLYDKAIKTAARKQARGDRRSARRVDSCHGLVIDDLGQIIDVPRPVVVVDVAPEPTFIAASLPVALGHIALGEPQRARVLEKV